MLVLGRVKKRLTQHGDEGVDDQAYDQQHLAESSPEFGLAIPLDCHQIDDSVEYLEADGCQLNDFSEN